MKLCCTALSLITIINRVTSASVGASNDEIVFGQGRDDEITFMDSIYGELVDGEYELKTRKELIDTGALRSPVDGLSDIGEAEEKLENDHFKYGSFNIEQQHREVRSKKAHSAFQRYQTKLKLPEKDDTSDLNSDPNLFGGIVTFGHFPHINCFDPDTFDERIDIAVVGAPFDTGTSYRPGARFGPESIRSSSRRLLGGITPVRGNKRGSKLGKIDPWDTRNHNLTLVDCGDVPMTPFDNRIALNQLYRGVRSIHNHKSGTKEESPKVITVGGDHTITLMAIKSAFEKYGKLSVLHFDSHIDTWDPKVLGGGLSHYMELNHGTFLHYAHEKGYLSPTNFHVGLRAPYIDSSYDQKHDADCGFQVITARDFDHMSKDAISKKIKDTVGSGPVYISVDIDVLDPAHAPGTGTMEIGGLSGRELLSVLDGLNGLHVVGADVVEVSPPYDSNSEITSLAATSVIDSFLGLMVSDEIDIA